MTTTSKDTPPSATIKLFLPFGNAKSLRTAEISNWTGKAIAAPRTELEELLARKELAKAGIYVLTGTDPATNAPHAYIGEAEIIRERLKQHKSKEFRVSAIVFVSKDENLTKAHVRYLEERLLSQAAEIGRFTLEQNQAGGSKLPESDRSDMDVFYGHMKQLLPVLGSDLLTPAAEGAPEKRLDTVLILRTKELEARGFRTEGGFAVLKGSTAILNKKNKSKEWITALRKQLVAKGTLVEKNGIYEFSRNSEFSSPSAAASVIKADSINGLLAWRNEEGKALRDLDAQG
jgi:hypothetical protein